MPERESPETAAHALLGDSHQPLRRGGLAAMSATPHLKTPQSETRLVADVVQRLNTALAGRYAIERELGSGGMGPLI